MSLLFPRIYIVPKNCYFLIITIVECCLKNNALKKIKNKMLTNKLNGMRKHNDAVLFGSELVAVGCLREI